MSTKRTLVCLGLVFAGCTLGSLRVLVSASPTVPSTTAVGGGFYADVILVGTGDGKMVQVDLTTGAELGTYWLWNGSNSAPVGMSWDRHESSAVWALHADGYVVEWADGPTLNSWFTVPFPDGHVDRTYCDLDKAEDGDFYISTVDDGMAKVWRRDGSSNFWGVPVDLGTEGCPRIGHDMYFDELNVLLGDGSTFLSLDPTTLAELGSTSLDVDGGALSDLDVWAGKMVGVGTDGSWWQTAKAWTYDPLTGVRTSSKMLHTLAPTTVHGTYNPNTGDGEVLISTGGTSVVVAVALDGVWPSN